MVGQVGVDGTLAVNPVEVVSRNALGAARSLRQVMAGKTVKEQRGRVVGATRIRVLVSVGFRSMINVVFLGDQHYAR